MCTTHTHTHTPICGCCCDSVSKSCPTLWPHGLQHARLPCPSLSPTFAQIHVHLVNDTIQPSHSLSPLLLLPSVFPSPRIFSSELAFSIRWAKYWSFSFSISPSSEYSGLVSFSIDWFDLLAVQGTLESLLQHHNSKASILWHSAFFMIQLSHPYVVPCSCLVLISWFYNICFTLYYCYFLQVLAHLLYHSLLERGFDSFEESLSSPLPSLYTVPCPCYLLNK